MKLSFVGFLVKKTSVEKDYMGDLGVSEICSVSECIHDGGHERVQLWLHNKAGFYNSEGDAHKVVAEEDLSHYSVFAYRMVPMVFGENGAETLNMSCMSSDIPIAEEPDLQGFESLGFDLVSRSVSDFFECSPLSCNALAKETPVNQYCLIDSLNDAMTLADRLGREEIAAEPGPYYVFEVLRRK